MAFGSNELTSTVAHGVRVWQAGDGPAVVALAGPPTSALLFRHLARPLHEAGYALVAPELFHPPPVAASPADLARRIAPLVPPGATVLSHGLALPVALELLDHADVRGLAICNGPIAGLDPFSRALARVAAVAPALARALLKPGFVVPAMASSLALRRTVTNPYVMDRDIVAMLSAPLLATAAHRRAVAEYLGHISRMTDGQPTVDVPVILLWAAADLLYPLPPDPTSMVNAAEISAICLPGARFFHIEERPWEVARALVTWLDGLFAEATATQMS